MHKLKKGKRQRGRPHAIAAICKYPDIPAAYVEDNIRYTLLWRVAGRSVNNLNPDGRIALSLEDIIHKILLIKIYLAASVWIVLTQQALRIQAAQRPAKAREKLSDKFGKSSSSS